VNGKANKKCVPACYRHTKGYFIDLKLLSLKCNCCMVWLNGCLRVVPKSPAWVLGTTTTLTLSISSLVDGAVLVFDTLQSTSIDTFPSTLVIVLKV